jgi:hypothetical protein
MPTRVDYCCPACGGTGVPVIIHAQPARTRAETSPLDCDACAGTGRKIKHGDYLISIEVGSDGYVAWVERADGEPIVSGCNMGRRISTYRYGKRRLAIQTAVHAVDSGEIG